MIVGTVALALVPGFVAIYRGTGAQVRHGIEKELREESRGFLARLARSPTSPARIQAAARSYIDSQPFSSSAVLLFAQVPGRPVATNQPDVLRVGRPREQEREPSAVQRDEARQARALLHAPLGYSTVDAADVGGIRLLTTSVGAPGGASARIGVGEPLAPVNRAQAGVARTFGLVGLMSLAVAALVGSLLASRTSRPLRRMARTAAAVDAGDLSHRMSERSDVEEVRVLAEAFDHMLDRLDDAFSRQRAFVAEASHELRTPLTVIRGQLEVLVSQAEVSRSDVRRVEGVVRTEVTRMERLVEDLLVLAQADEGQLLRRTSIELAPFVEELVEGLAAASDRRFELDPVPPGRLDADGDRIAQVLRNLTKNAVQHTRRGGLVHVSLAPTNGDVTFAVEDDGPGIPTNERERIFDRFHRKRALHDADGGGGVGLGLAIARAIVEAHGGHIEAGQSRYGGARLAFRIPGFHATGGAGSLPD